MAVVGRFAKKQFRNQMMTGCYIGFLLYTILSVDRDDERRCRKEAMSGSVKKLLPYAAHISEEKKDSIEKGCA